MEFSAWNSVDGIQSMEFSPWNSASRIQCMAWNSAGGIQSVECMKSVHGIYCNANYHDFWALNFV